VLAATALRHGSQPAWKNSANPVSSRLTTVNPPDSRNAYLAAQIYVIAGSGGMGKSGVAPPRMPAPEVMKRATIATADRRTSLPTGSEDGSAQPSSWMRIRLPAGSRKAQSRTPYGCSVGSWTTSASLAWSRSKVPSRSVVARLMLA
jgi:hypothetical protein